LGGQNKIGKKRWTNSARHNSSACSTTSLLQTLFPCLKHAQDFVIYVSWMIFGDGNVLEWISQTVGI